MKRFFLIFFSIVFIFTSTICFAEESKISFEFDLKIPEEVADIYSLREARKKDPLNIDLQFSLGSHIISSVYFSMFKDALIDSTTLLAGIKKNKSDTDINNFISEAIGLLDSVIEKGSEKYPEAYFVRGVASMLVGDFPEALADYYTALEKDLKTEMVSNASYIVLSYMWPLLSSAQEAAWGDMIAARIAERIGKMEHPRLEDYHLASKIYLRSGDYGKALMLAEHGLKIDSGNKTLLSTRSEIISNIEQ